MPVTNTYIGTVYPNRKDGQDALILRYTNTGQCVLNFDISETHSRKDQTGNWVKDEKKGLNGVSYRRVTLWGDTAEHVANMIRQAAASTGGYAKVIVVGTETVDHYKAQDGTDRVSVVVNARHVGIVPTMPRQATGGQTQQAGGVVNQQAAQAFSQPQQQAAPGGGMAGDPWATQQPQQGYPSQPPF